MYEDGAGIDSEAVPGMMAALYLTFWMMT